MDTPLTAARRGSLLVLAAGGLAIAGAFLWCLLVVPETTRDAYPNGDGALLELYTVHARTTLRGGPVWGYGPYSRFGWHHPGPIFFYLMTPFYTAARDHALALQAGSFAINAAALTAIAWCAVRYLSPALAVSLLIGLASYLARLPIMLISAWNPHTVVLPFAALMIASSLVASGRLSLLLVVAASASFVAQTYVGLVPCVAAAVLCAIGGGLWHARRDPEARPRFWIGSAAALLLLLWLPALIQQVTAPPREGNLTKLFRFFVNPVEDYGGIPFREALAIWATVWSTPVRPELRLPIGWVLQLVDHPAAIALVVLALPALAVAGWWTWRRGQHADAWCAWISGLLSIAALVSTARIRGGIADHLVSWVAIIGLIALACLAAAAWQRLTATLTRRIPARVAATAAAITAIAVLIGTSALGGRELERLRARLPRAEPDAPIERLPVEMLFRNTRAILLKAHIRKPLFHVGGTYGETAAMVLQYHKRGYPVAVAPDAVWLYGAVFAARGDEDADLTVADRATRAQLAARPGDCMLVERHGYSVHLLLSSVHRPEDFVCE